MLTQRRWLLSYFNFVSRCCVWFSIQTSTVNFALYCLRFCTTIADNKQQWYIGIFVAFISLWEYFDAKVHFLHFDKAWKVLGMFNSGETSTRETKERQHMQTKPTILSIQVLRTYISSLKFLVNNFQWQYFNEAFCRKPHRWSRDVFPKHQTDRLDWNWVKA